MGIKYQMMEKFKGIKDNEWVQFKSEKLDFSLRLTSTRISFKVDRQFKIGFSSFSSTVGLKVMSMSQPELADGIIYLRGSASSSHNKVAERNLRDSSNLYTHLEKIMISLYEFSYGEEAYTVLHEYLESGKITVQLRCNYCNAKIEEGIHCKKCLNLSKYSTIKSIEDRIKEIDKAVSISTNVDNNIQEIMAIRLGFINMNGFKKRCNLDKIILRSMMVEKIYNGNDINVLEKEIDEEIDYGEMIKV